MTDSQYKYQMLMEDQRHNLAMERLGGSELKVKQIQAEASTQQALAALQQAAAAERNATSREREVSIAKSRQQVEAWNRVGDRIYEFGTTAKGIAQSGYSSALGLFGTIGNLIKTAKSLFK